MLSLSLLISTEEMGLISSMENYLATRAYSSWEKNEETLSRRANDICDTLLFLSDVASLSRKNDGHEGLTKYLSVISRAKIYADGDRHVFYEKLGNYELENLAWFVTNSPTYIKNVVNALPAYYYGRHRGRWLERAFDLDLPDVDVSIPSWVKAGCLPEADRADFVESVRKSIWTRLSPSIRSDASLFYRAYVQGLAAPFFSYESFLDDKPAHINSKKIHNADTDSFIKNCLYIFGTYLD